MRSSRATPDTSLIDITRAPLATKESALDYVGMQGIDLPLYLLEDGQCQHYMATADVGVNLGNTNAKGIHMSRLYLLLNTFSTKVCTSQALSQLLQSMVESQQEAFADKVELTLQFRYLRAKPALQTTDLTGWQSYPIRIKASWQAAQFRLQLSTDILYSSTCPCSAALSRQLLQQKFLTDFANEQSITKNDMADWLLEQGSYATPHSQRSVATITVDISEQLEFGIAQLILLAEQSLATPVQTAVKRADEQAFAKLNGQNLMFVEDAARRLAKAIGAKFPIFSLEVKHLESLHPHDAVARATNLQLP